MKLSTLALTETRAPGPGTKSASAQQRPCPALLIFMVHPALPKGIMCKINLSILPF